MRLASDGTSSRSDSSRAITTGRSPEMRSPYSNPTSTVTYARFCLSSVLRMASRMVSMAAIQLFISDSASAAKKYVLPLSSTGTISKQKGTLGRFCETTTSLNSSR